MRYTLERNVLSAGNAIPWVMFSGAHGLTVEWYHKGHAKSKAPALDTEYPDKARKMCAKNRTSDAPELTDTLCPLDLCRTLAQPYQELTH